LRVPEAPIRKPRDFKVVHVFVVLCDNANQGIVRVPAAIGNGQDPASNLYWGARYGVRTFFTQSPHWTVLQCRPRPAQAAVLERAVFRSKAAGPPVYVVADAYDGARMREALAEFLGAAAGLAHTEVEVASAGAPTTLQAGGWSDLVAFVGHNGLMDVRLSELPENRGGPNPDAAVILACKSQPYFAEPLRKAKCTPLVTTVQFMAPEAYTLDAILRGWASGQTPEAVRQQAAAAYAAYQKCSLTAAGRIFVSGWQ
jgi:hypothetical protein